MQQDSETTAAGTVTVHRDGAVVHLVLERPQRRNSLSPTMVETLVTALTEAASDDSLRAIHLRGAGGDFCSGVDWVATNDAGTRPRPGDLVRRIPHAAHRVIELLHTVQLPVVCSVRGWAAGLGCQLALASDFSVAADDLVGRLAAGPTVALGLAKQALAYGQHATLAQSLHQELYDLELSCRTSDFKEGLSAFRQRRAPQFGGR